MPAPPFMHGAAHWMAFNSFAGGNTLVLPHVVDHFDASDAINVIEEEGVNILLIVGDAFGRPLVEEIESADHDLSSMLVTISGGAALSAGIKNRLLDAVPSMMVMDGLGASETGSQAAQTSASGQQASTGSFTPGPGMRILDEGLTRVLDAGHQEVGWLAQRERVPSGISVTPRRAPARSPWSTASAIRFRAIGPASPPTANSSSTGVIR